MKAGFKFDHAPVASRLKLADIAYLQPVETKAMHSMRVSVNWMNSALVLEVKGVSG